MFTSNALGTLRVELCFVGEILNLVGNQQQTVSCGEIQAHQTLD